MKMRILCVCLDAYIGVIAYAYMYLTLGVCVVVYAYNHIHLYNMVLDYFDFALGRLMRKHSYLF